MSNTELVNIKETGRDGVTMIDRSSRFGNPYPEDEYGREECIRKYRLWFASRIGEDEQFRQAVERLRGKTLGCWCKPLDCHGDVILEYLERTAEEQGGNR